MSRKHRKGGHHSGHPSGRAPKLNPQGNFMIDPMSAQADAMKTYLNQEVALLRPQVAYSEIAHLWRLAVTARSAIELRAESMRQVDFKLGNADGVLLEDVPNRNLSAKAIMLQNAFQSNFQSVIERSETSFCC